MCKTLAEKNSDDKSLLLAIQDGDRGAFNMLVERHSQMFYRIAYRYLNRREEAEDTVQDAFLKLWERPDSWDAKRENKFTTWFYRIVVNLCLDKQRKKKPESLSDEYDVIDENSMEVEQTEMNQQRQAISKAIDSLPDRQKQALILCFYEGFSNQEAAAFMQLRTRALQSLLMRAKDNLKKALNSESVE